MREKKKVEIYILTGFLGSGKSTLLTRLVKAEKKRERRVGVIMNELGEISIDSAFVPADVPLAELLDGCICCSIQGELTQQLYNLLMKYKLDAIYIEATGAAHPMEVVEACTHPSLAIHTDVSAVVSVVDMKLWQDRERLKRSLKNLVEAQVRYADVIIGNKRDHVATDVVHAVEENMKAWNSQGRYFFTEQADVPVEYIFSTTHSEGKEKEEPSHSSAHVHNHLHLRTFTYVLDRPLHRIAFEKWVRTLPEGIHRGKGFVHFTDHPRMFLFQYAYGEPVFLPYNSNEGCEDVLVFIGEDINRERMAEELEQLTMNEKV